jgi:DNA-binding beta-propeller fold protein YncE
VKRLLAAVVLVLAFPAAAQQAPDLEAARQTVAAIQGMLKQRPNEAVLYFYLARFEGQLGNAEGAAAALEKVAELGDGYLPGREGGFERVWDDARFQAAYRKVEARLPRLDFAPTAFELEDRTLIPEGIAYDPRSQGFFMGSIQGKVLRVMPGGEVSEFLGKAAGFDAILGLAVDAPRRILYVVSTSALTTEGRKKPRNSVLAFDVDSRKLLRRIEAPNAQQLNDVTIALGGRVFATDSSSGAIYEIPVVGEAREIIAPNQVRGSNGIAPSPDGKRLYVAHSTGLAVIDIDTKKLQRVANPTRENISGFDGLYMWQGQLVGVQNITNPGRVVAVTLTGDGNSVQRVQTLLSHHHSALMEPTTGAVTDHGFYLLAATGVTRFNQDGKIDDPATVPKPLVLRVPLPR